MLKVWNHGVSHRLIKVLKAASQNTAGSLKRRSQLSPAIADISSSVSVKSNSARFSCSRSLRAVLGMMAIPR